MLSLSQGDHNGRENKSRQPPSYMRWPHKLTGQVHGLSLREIGGGFTRHHRAPSVRAACYAIAKPSTMVQKMQNIKSVRGHRNAVYCGKSSFVFLLMLQLSYYYLILHQIPSVTLYISMQYTHLKDFTACSHI